MDHIISHEAWNYNKGFECSTSRIRANLRANPKNERVKSSMETSKKQLIEWAEEKRNVFLSRLEKLNVIAEKEARNTRAPLQVLTDSTSLTLDTGAAEFVPSGRSSKLSAESPAFVPSKIYCSREF